MVNFVHQRGSANKYEQANDGRHGYFEDLKETVPKSGKPANTPQPRAQGVNVVQHRVQNGQERGREQVDAKGPFYGTEASSIGDSSETPDAEAIRDAQAQASRKGAYAQDDHATQLSSDSQYTEADGEFQEYENENTEKDMRSGTPFGGLGPVAIEETREFDAAKRRKGAGPISGRMVGDSYPSTTTPPQSVREAVEREPMQVKLDDGPTQIMPPLKGPAQQQWGDAAKRQPPLHGEKLEIRPSQPHLPQNQPARAYFQRPDAMYQTSKVLQLHGGFNWHAPGANPRTSVNAPRSHQRQPNETVNSSRKDPWHGTAEPHRASGIERSDEPAAHAPTGKGLYEGPPRQPLPEDHQIAERHAPTKRVQIEQPPHSNAQSPPMTSSEKAPFSNQQPQQEPMSSAEEEHVADIDYDVSELYDMDYSMLRRQSFDIDPRHEAPAFPSMEKSDPINQQMDTAASFDKKLQHAFLASMPIDDWEQAGDWFLGKFSDTLQKLKDVRQEKRTAARQFETEIEKRHVAVTQKRKITDDVLREIKKSGNLVLEGTPKKAKTK